MSLPPWVSEPSLLIRGSFFNWEAFQHFPRIWIERRKGTGKSLQIDPFHPKEIQKTCIQLNIMAYSIPPLPGRPCGKPCRSYFGFSRQCDRYHIQILTIVHRIFLQYGIPIQLCSSKNIESWAGLRLQRGGHRRYGRGAPRDSERPGHEFSRMGTLRGQQDSIHRWALNNFDAPQGGA